MAGSSTAWYRGQDVGGSGAGLCLVGVHGLGSGGVRSVFYEMALVHSLVSGLECWGFGCRALLSWGSRLKFEWGAGRGRLLRNGSHLRLGIGVRIMGVRVQGVALLGCTVQIQVGCGSRTSFTKWLSSSAWCRGFKMVGARVEGVAVLGFTVQVRAG